MFAKFIFSVGFAGSMPAVYGFYGFRDDFLGLSLYVFGGARASPKK